MNIIIPLGGTGERFKIMNYTKPKPLIKVLGKEIICWLLDSLSILDDDNVIIPYHHELYNHNFEGFLKNKYPNINFIFIKIDNQIIKGSAETLRIALNALSAEVLVRNTMCIDGDNFFLEDVVNTYRTSIIKNCVYYFNDTNPDPIYSYITLNENNLIQSIVEKQKISHNANCGIYCFESSHMLLDNCTKLVSQFDKKEYYTSMVIENLINMDISFLGVKINKHNFICLGTPMQVKSFCLNNMNNKAYSITQLRLCFDFDNTLVIKKDSDIEPNYKNIYLLKYLRSHGHIIIIQKSLCISVEEKENTIKLLKEFNIPYDEIYFEKPNADFYIGNNILNCYSDFEKELGFYQSKIDPRSFNSIEEVNMTILVKRSKDLSGEINWYLNIPNDIKDLFPLLIQYDKEKFTWYKMEKISGFPVSKIHLSENMSPDILLNILFNLEKIHNSLPVPFDFDVDIYENYCNKLKSRFESYNYSKFENSSETFNKIYNYLKIYQDTKQGIPSITHGDPVLTNIICQNGDSMYDNTEKLKFIDMRGKQGNKLTLFGDKFYDYAKLYQSLVGYDEILCDKFIGETYKTKMIDIFHNYIITTYSIDALKNIKYITASLLFSLIPLHDNEKCDKYYKLSQQMIQ
jgi:NDP-sugar pyrophosphorylase family protein